MLCRLLLLLILVIATSVSAAEIFHPNCTVPVTPVNLVTSPEVRGTFDILWSSLFTLLVCTWNIQHLTVPTQKPRGTKSCWEGWKDICRGKGCKTFGAALNWNFKRVRRRVKWMACSLILPELLVGLEFQNLMMASKSVEEMREYSQKDGVKWTLTHAFFANMGGFVVRAKSESSENEQESPESGQLFYPTASELYQARHTGIISKLLDIRAEEIEDKSKGDSFVKGAAVVQVLWLLIQIITRAFKGLPVSQLEIMVVAFSVCSFITYILCWSKPQHVLVPIEISGSAPLVREVGHCTSWCLASSPLVIMNSSPDPDIRQPPPNDLQFHANFEALAEHGYSFIDDGITFAGVIFGALHCLAWNFQFPHSSERLMWRLAAIISTTSLPVFYLLTGVLRSRLSTWIAASVQIAYCISRLYLIAESFRTLFFPPPELFISTWSSDIVHVA